MNKADILAQLKTLVTKLSTMSPSDAIAFLETLKARIVAAEQFEAYVESSPIGKMLLAAVTEVSPNFAIGMTTFKEVVQYLPFLVNGINGLESLLAPA